MALPFAAFMFLHKISYVFVFFIFLPLISRKNLTIEKKIIFKYVIFLFFFTIPWLIKNYIVTSCFVYPVKLSCFSNSIYELKGLANPINASWLTEIWAKGFIDHPNWQNINLKEYASGFNWVPTWFSGHLHKILEIVSPLIFKIFLFVVYFYFEKKNFLILKDKRKFLTLLYQLWIANLFGLLIWFSNAPVFRYGSFYVISFVILSFVLLFDYFFIVKKSKNLKFFKVIIFISLSFFIIKNSLRINESSNSFFPKTSKNETEFIIYEKNGLKILKPKKDLCYFTNSICSHEIPKNINVIKFGNYDIFN